MSAILSIEGNIGSGKSSFAAQLEKLLSHQYDSTINGKKIIILQEPVDEWMTIKDKSGETILSKFYNDQDKYAFSFQMMAYISRQSLLNKTVEANPNSIIITERCIHTDKEVFASMLAADGKIESVNHEIYKKWFDEFSRHTQYTSHIYLEVDAETCFKRVNVRNRDGESIPVDYLEKCNIYHDQWLKNKSNVIRIDMNGGAEAHIDLTDKCQSIIEYLKSL